MRASRGLKWENKTYKLKTSIVTMTVQLTKSRKQKLKNACLNLINKETCTVQNVAEVRNWADRVKFSRGETCPLHYHSLERDKSNGLQANKGNWILSCSSPPVLKQN